jgi:O-antigen ligase
MASLPWIFRVALGAAPFQRTGFDGWVAVFVITAGAGLWASQDPLAASDKFFLILASALLFYALSSQPEENHIWVAAMLFCLGLGVSIYFFLTHDFIEAPRKLDIVNVVGRWIMQVRPSLPWTPIHPNYVSGIAAITTPFIFPLWKTRKEKGKKYSFPIAVAGLIIILFAIFMTTSRGVLMAMASVVGVWVLWRIVRLSRINLPLGKEAVFSTLVLFFLAAVVLFLYLGPATLGGIVTQTSHYGDGSRAEVFGRSAYLIADFPFTGGGLGAFPALYSQYLLVIPHTYLPNAHNLFLDVFIEQGILGGIAFLAMYFAGIWQAARLAVIGEPSVASQFGWIVLAALVMAFVHGLVDDYLYFGYGTILAMVPIGAAAMLKPSTSAVKGSLIVRKGCLGLLTVVFVTGLILMNVGRIRAAWFANVGAVQMARVELAGFPTGKWAEPDLIPAIIVAEPALLASLEADPANRTANHRLGLLAMARRDFSSAVAYLEAAHVQSPGHRGINKVLGYSYVWLAEFEKARIILKDISEAGRELDVYVWWWETQGRSDLSANAFQMSNLLADELVQP